MNYGEKAYRLYSPYEVKIRRAERLLLRFLSYEAQVVKFANERVIKDKNKSKRDKSKSNSTMRWALGRFTSARDAYLRFYMTFTEDVPFWMYDGKNMTNVASAKKCEDALWRSWYNL